jgi:hypothetical protein
MSGTETLVPYLGGKKKKNGEEPTIIVDSREASTAVKIVKGLIERGVKVRTEALEKGDYILSDQCAVERKTVSDFVYTLTRRYLFEQLFRLKDVYPKSLILLEGYLRFGVPCLIWQRTALPWSTLLLTRRRLISCMWLPDKSKLWKRERQQFTRLRKLIRCLMLKCFLWLVCPTLVEKKPMLYSSLIKRR